MLCNSKVLCALLLAGLLAASPALATVNVYFEPAVSVVAVGDTVDVYLMADVSDVIGSWGLDINMANPATAVLDSFSVFPFGWDEVLQSIDGDDIGALSFSGNGPGLMTLGIATFEGVAEGITTASLGMDDEDENFLLFGSLIVDEAVTFSDATIQVIPEPATLAMFAVAGLALLRRRS